MRHEYSSEHPHAKFDVVEWLVVTLILTVAFFAALQVVGEDLRGAVLSAWETVASWLP